MHNTKSTMANKCTFFAGCFDGLGNPPLQYQAHLPMEDILVYIRGHWMPPPGDYLHRIAPAAARVIGLAHTTKVVTVKRAPPKLAAKRHNTDPLLSSSMPQALYNCDIAQLELKSSAIFLAIKH